WNVDGLKHDTFAWLVAYLKDKRPHIFCLNETKQSAANLQKLFEPLAGYRFVINAHSPSNLHGVAVLIRRDVPYERVDLELKCATRHDAKRGSTAAAGRLIGKNGRTLV